MESNLEATKEEENAKDQEPVVNDEAGAADQVSIVLHVYNDTFKLQQEKKKKKKKKKNKNKQEDDENLDSLINDQFGEEKDGNT